MKTYRPAWVRPVNALPVIVLVLLVTHPGRAFGQDFKEELVTVQAGDIPIILSAPHGGRLAIPKVDKRLGVGVRSFRTVMDTRTDLLTQKIADEIEKETGKRPFLVIAQFHRRYVDANRKPERAFESPNAKPVYEAYHQAIRDAKAQVIKHWGFGLLLDVHGQAAEPKAIIRGTQNGKTVKHLLARFGDRALIGESSLFGEFSKQGIDVIPKVDSKAKEDDRYDGGFIVQTYGSGMGGTLDAIQLELGGELRSRDRIDQTAKELASSIVTFANAYLKLNRPELLNSR